MVGKRPKTLFSAQKLMFFCQFRPLATLDQVAQKRPKVSKKRGPNQDTHPIEKQKFAKKTVQFCKLPIMFGKNRSFKIWEDPALSKQNAVWSVYSKFGLSWTGNCQKKSQLGVLDILFAKVGMARQLVWLEGRHRPRKGFGDVASLTLSLPVLHLCCTQLCIDTDFAVVILGRA